MADDKPKSVEHTTSGAAAESSTERGSSEPHHAEHAADHRSWADIPVDEHFVDEEDRQEQEDLRRRLERMRATAATAAANTVRAAAAAAAASTAAPPPPSATSGAAAPRAPPPAPAASAAAAAPVATGAATAAAAAAAPAAAKAAAAAAAAPAAAKAAVTAAAAAVPKAAVAPTAATSAAPAPAAGGARSVAPAPTSTSTSTSTATASAPAGALATSPPPGGAAAPAAPAPAPAPAAAAAAAAAAAGDADTAAAAGAPAGGDEDDLLPHLRGGLDPQQWRAEVEVQQNDPNSPLFSVSSFEELGLSPELLRGVYAMKFSKPSKIQEKALPLIIKPQANGAYENIIAQSQSGTGKTAAFVLGMLSRVDPRQPHVQALCVCPTRELALQIASVARVMAKYSQIRVLALNPEIQYPAGQRLTDHVVIGTPGKVVSLLMLRIIDSRTIRIFVLDEADQMIDKQGFADDSTRIKRVLTPSCQVLLFSATFRPDVQRYALSIVPRATRITLKREQLSLDGIKQFYIQCRNDDMKYRVLSDVYAYLAMGQSIIFANRRATCQELAARLRGEGHAVSLIHGGDMLPSERDKVMDEFRRGQTKVLIATNVLARGIDVLQVSIVINYEMPVDLAGSVEPETYLHRIGRSGRFGRRGAAVNLVDAQGRRMIDALEKYYNHAMKELDPMDIAAIERELGDATK